MFLFISALTFISVVFVILFYIYTSQNKNIIVIPNVYLDSQFYEIEKHTRVHRDILYNLPNDPFMPGRKNFKIPKIEALNLHGYTHDPNMYVDYGVYYTGSEGMDWFKDAMKAKGNTYDAFLIILDDSNSKFQYKNAFGLIKTLNIDKNTLVLIKPGTIEYRFTPVQTGNKEILNFVLNKTMKF
jgi:hypothetical protein